MRLESCRGATMNRTTVCVIILLSLRKSIAADPSHCFESSGNFTSNSTYEKNLNLILSSLPSNTTNADRRYYTGSVGHGLDRVYALSLCRPDSSPRRCTDCVSSAVEQLRQHCPYKKEAYTWQILVCTVRYSDRSNMFGRLELEPTDNVYNAGDVSTDMEQFDRKWEGLMLRVLSEASSNEDKFASGNAGLGLFRKIYTMMQCVPDLSESDCGECLRAVVRLYQRCCHGKAGSRILKPSCFIRWELYSFDGSNSTLDLQSPPPSPLLVLPPTPISKQEIGVKRRSAVMIVVITSISLLAFVLVLSCFLFHRRNPDTKKQDVESLQFDFGTIKSATDNFSDANKLGEGGFGAVYKGMLSNGEAIAVKRLGKDSGQGQLEFKNEVMLLARLEHRNLVRLLGFCLEGQERLLIYELLNNSSLDNYIFDRSKRRILDWGKRYKIIGGIARGLLYLHEDSRLRIIHRDLKASNILLDEEINPKISDFGMARLFEVDQSQDETRRIVGTFGYMAPEYARHGQFSVKSDVFSFGVLVLEIISGQKNTCFCNGEEGETLLTYAWKKWNEGRARDLIDTSLRHGSRSEMMRCINIGLLCVQDNVADRPTMAYVVVMLSSRSISLNVPSRPAFYIYSTIQPHNSKLSSTSTNHSNRSNNDPAPFSVNEVSITELYPR